MKKDDTAEVLSIEGHEVLNVTKEVLIECAYDFSFAKKADSELIQAGWKP